MSLEEKVAGFILFPAKEFNSAADYKTLRYCGDWKTKHGDNIWIFEVNAKDVADIPEALKKEFDFVEKYRKEYGVLNTSIELLRQVFTTQSCWKTIDQAQLEAAALPRLKPENVIYLTASGLNLSL
jgi:hypothetical protein